MDVITTHGDKARRALFRGGEDWSAVEGGDEVHDLQLPQFESRESWRQRVLDLLVQPVLRRVAQLLLAQQLRSCSLHTTAAF